MSEVFTHEVVSHPAPSVRPEAREYTSEQQELIAELREYALSCLLPDDDPYQPNERRWIEEPECCARYMRAAKWKMVDAKKRIKGTIDWRREYKPDLISADEVEPENESGKIILNGFDNDGRPIITMRPGRQNTKPSERQILHLIFCLERAIDYMPPNQDSMMILVDYRSASLKTNPSISTAIKVLGILQNHYVERLGRAIVVRLPVLLNFFFKGIGPFMDPVTREKMKFNPSLPDLIPAEHLEAEFGGNFNYKFDHKSYWEQVCRHSGVRPDGSRYTPDWKKTISVETTPDSTSVPASLPDLVNDTDVDSSRAPSVHIAAAGLPPAQTLLDSAFKGLQLDPTPVNVVTPQVSP
ncbi:hypothetical protein FRB94_001697 [Tulasnella sp. JGI-2019a]|nr:hypothetical protein FRB93_007188 [Tulasnella sp. JGI-2019a]KAG9013592.1 hypothetical protein FRB94_001697 [Tulasnella sp. JGI-2019a]KAG9029215.1 hypothetical protein FRB95_005585 [Tulasnella sp. JGI-2019a]